MSLSPLSDPPSDPLQRSVLARFFLLAIIQSHPPRNNHFHNFIGARIYRLHGRIRIIRRHRKLAHEPIAAMKLQTLARQALEPLSLPTPRHSVFLAMLGYTDML